MKRLTVTINGDSWRVRLMDRKAFNKIYKIKTALAVTHYLHNRKSPIRDIVFTDEGLQISTIRHEVTHAYLSYHTLSGMGLSDLEEFFADFVGSKLRFIDRISERIYRGLV